MTEPDLPAEPLDRALAALADRLVDRRGAAGHWEGALAASALSTATAIIALQTAGGDAGLVERGARWLAARQNADGGWGDTVRSRSNISTTAIVWSALSIVSAGGLPADGPASEARRRGEDWLRGAAGSLEPGALRAAILRRYGKDRTFSVPILTVLALAGKLGSETRQSWRLVPQLPFEVAALPHRWFHHLRLPVVSYALPALIAIGQVRHHRAPSRNPLLRALRNRARRRTLDVLGDMQPASGGYLEAAPLTSFVVMSLAAAGQARHPVAERGVRFLVDTARPDGSWPIDTNLATWVTTLAVTALAEAGRLGRIDAGRIRQWLLAQQTAREHPFTHAAPGGWAWTDLTGGVPDADDTSGALVALARLGADDEEVRRSAAGGIRWLLGVQNRDGGMPTFCRGWGALPFDRSTPEITAHALRAFSAWHGELDEPLRREVERSARRAVAYLARVQARDGAWAPLWFGNEHASTEENRTYGTARVVEGLQAALVSGEPDAARCRRLGVVWLLEAQNPDGGWGGARGLVSTIEETGVALAALAGAAADGDADGVRSAVGRGARWIADATRQGRETPAAPIGLYFARLWYFEELYPLVFALAGLGRARRYLRETDASARRGADASARRPYQVR